LTTATLGTGLVSSGLLTLLLLGAALPFLRGTMALALLCSVGRSLQGLVVSLHATVGVVLELPNH
jgi:hypothetical protein